MILRYLTGHQQKRIEQHRKKRPFPSKGLIGLPFNEAFELAQKYGRIMVLNKKMSELLLSEGEPLRKSGTQARWSGTMTAYAGPGEELGGFIEYTDDMSGRRWIFEVPQEYQKEKDALLVVEQPHYFLFDNGKDIVVEASNVECIPEFPQKNGWHLGDEVHDIPCGEECSPDDPRARNLFRLPEGRVGPIARGPAIIGFNGPRNVVISFLPSCLLGTIMQSAQESARILQQDALRP